MQSGLLVFLGAGDGLVPGGVEYLSVNSGSHSFPIAADFDEDGHLDVLADSKDGMGVSLLRGLGDGNLRLSITTGLSARKQDVAVGDLNGDGHSDVVASLVSGVLVVLLGDGKGNLAGPREYAANTWPASLRIADFDLDGKQDIVAGNSNLNSSVTVMLGAGDGSSPLRPFSLLATHLDGWT